ncbi:MAG TPA: glycosyltransferase family 4 protein [Cellvibrio sp.]|nr:glycosyltransferase family 4 protein [Cellvibrio sp.]
MGMLIGLFILLFACGYLLTQGLIHYAHKKQLLDIANHRSSHTQATPRIGGLSFVILISMLIAGYAVFINKESTAAILIFILAPALIVAITGLLDDVINLSQRVRFILYFLSSLLALGNLNSLFAQPLWILVSGGLILSLSLTWLINLFNFMDGIDGIAASESLFVLAALSLFAYQASDIDLNYLLILSTAPIAGFLMLNWQPARIFMGDIGSTFLGALIGCLCFYMINAKFITFYSVVILLAAFVVDATWTLSYRLATGQKWYQAHRSHNYQILARKLSSHSKVTSRYSLINIGWLLPLALAAQHYQQHALLITTISLLPLILQCFIIGAGKHDHN